MIGHPRRLDVWELDTLNGMICRIAVALCLSAALAEAIRVGARRPAAVRAALALALPATALAVAVRLLSPWGPLINSGRDLRYLDEVVYGPSRAHTHLMAALLAPARLFENVLGAFEVGQILLGGLVAGLTALLTYGLVGRRLPAMTAGLLAAVLVVLARVDASPNATVALKVMLLTTLLCALRYLRTGGLLPLIALAAGLLAVAYGRLEGGLWSGLVLVWVAYEQAGEQRRRPPQRWAKTSSLAAVSGLLVLTMGAALLHRLLLVPLSLTILALLWRRRGGWPLSKGLTVSSAVCAVALLPRVVELAALERETASRFPGQLLLLFGKTNILLFDPGLCTPLCAVLILLGAWRRRSADGRTHRYAALVALPVMVFALLFMGNASARMKLQGMGILLLLPLAGLGAERLVAWLAGRWGARHRWWLALGAAIVASAVLVGWRSLRSPTSLDQEYRWMRGLDHRVAPGSVVYQLPPAEEKSLLPIPGLIAERAGIELREISPETWPALPPKTLIWLGAGCRRFREGEPLPGVGRALGESLLAYPDWSFAEKLLRFMADKHGTQQQIFDRLDVGERPWCAEARRRYRLVEHRVTWVPRSPLDGQWMPPRTPVGLFRSTSTAR